MCFYSVSGSNDDINVKLTRVVDEWINHENYTDNTSCGYDIAVARMVTAFEISESTTHIILPSRREMIEERISLALSECYAVGKVLLLLLLKDVF